MAPTPMDASDESGAGVDVGGLERAEAQRKLQAELTQKLLAFGRKAQAQVLPLDVKALVHQVAGILEHTGG